MSKGNEQQEKSGKKAPEMNLKEKRAAKAAKRNKNNDNAIDTTVFAGKKK